jgi:hypothetical protein
MKMSPLRRAVAPAVALLQIACSGHVDPGGASGPDLRAGAARACDPAAVADAPYHDVAELDALVVGRWVRCEGPPQIEGEELGVDFTEGRVILPLVRGPDGGDQDAPPAPGVGAESWSAIVDSSGSVRLLFLWASSPTKDRPSIVVDGPTFFDHAEQMFLRCDEGGATYARLGP